MTKVLTDAVATQPMRKTIEISPKRAATYLYEGGMRGGYDVVKGVSVTLVRVQNLFHYYHCTTS